MAVVEGSIVHGDFLSGSDVFFGANVAVACEAGIAFGPGLVVDIPSDIGKFWVDGIDNSSADLKYIATFGLVGITGFKIRFGQ